MHSRQQHKRWHLKGSTLVKCTGYINSAWLKALLAFTVWVWMYNYETEGGRGGREDRGQNKRKQKERERRVFHVSPGFSEVSLSCEHCHRSSVLVPFCSDSPPVSKTSLFQHGEANTDECASVCPHSQCPCARIAITCICRRKIYASPSTTNHCVFAFLLPTRCSPADGGAINIRH